jgi:hypothetical protein
MVESSTTRTVYCIVQRNEGPRDGVVFELDCVGLLGEGQTTDSSLFVDHHRFASPAVRALMALNKRQSDGEPVSCSLSLSGIGCSVPFCHSASYFLIFQMDVT